MLSASSTGAMHSRYTDVVYKLAWPRLLANDVDKHAFHRQLGSTGVAQAIGMDTLLNAGFTRESRPRAGGQALSPRGQPGAQRFLCGALYTVFLVFFYNVVAFLTIMELRKAHIT
jgi:hypothetical protein